MYIPWLVIIGIILTKNTDSIVGNRIVSLTTVFLITSINFIN